MERLPNIRYSQPWSGALICVGRQMIRSANGSGSGGLATAGCGQAEGSPKGEALAAGATRLRKQSPSLSGDHEAGVQSEGSAPRVNLSTRRTGPLRVWRRPLGSGPMSFARGLTKGHSVEDSKHSNPRADLFQHPKSTVGGSSKKLRVVGEGVR